MSTTSLVNLPDNPFVTPSPRGAGTGHLCGTVYRAVLLDTGESFAVKQILTSAERRSDLQARKEAHYLLTPPRPNAVAMAMRVRIVRIGKVEPEILPSQGDLFDGIYLLVYTCSYK